MKPNWKDAPEWANYLAMDEDDEWFWFETQPTQGLDGWNEGEGLWEYVSDTCSCEWLDSLEQRPHNDAKEA